MVGERSSVDYDCMVEAMSCRDNQSFQSRQGGFIVIEINSRSAAREAAAPFSSAVLNLVMLNERSQKEFSV